MAMADRDGVVEASVPGLAKRAGVERDQCEQALTVFLSPDLDSRTTDHEGRRIEAVQGGWRLLNYEAYRQRASAEEAKLKAAERKRRQRARQKAAVTPVVTPVVGQSVTSVTITGRPPIAPAPAKAEAEAKIPDPIRRVISNAPASNKADEAERAGRLIERYSDLYTEHRNGARLRLIGNSLEFQEACSLVRVWPDSRLDKLAVVVLTTDDDWISNTDRAFKIFALKASWADDRLKAWETANGVSVG